MSTVQLVPRVKKKIIVNKKYCKGKTKVQYTWIIQYGMIYGRYQYMAQRNRVFMIDCTFVQTTRKYFLKIFLARIKHLRYPYINFNRKNFRVDFSLSFEGKRKNLYRMALYRGSGTVRSTRVKSIIQILSTQYL